MTTGSDRRDLPSVSVIVPSFGRPTLLAACLGALARQEVAPAEVLVVARRGDDATAALARQLGASVREVSRPGHLPPLAVGVAAAGGEVVAFLDDDAEPWRDWLAKLLRHYADPRVGGAGGLVAQGGERDPSVRTGRITRAGRFDALHHERVPRDWGAREVDALRGTNMSFRRALLATYVWDARLNGGAATDYEIDVCAHVRNSGHGLVWDPDAVVVHHLGDRPELGRRADRAAIRSYSHNKVYVAGKALPRRRASLAVAGSLLVGNRLSYGVATAVADTLLGRPPSAREELVPALAGKLAGLRSLAALARSGPEPLSPRPPD